MSDEEEILTNDENLISMEEDRNQQNYSEEENAFEIEEEEEEDDLSWLETNKPKTKQKEFHSLSPEELINQQQKEVLDTSEVLGIPVSISGILLRSYEWNKEK